jgi:hypothetical protein
MHETWNISSISLFIVIKSLQIVFYLNKFNVKENLYNEIT